MESYQKISRLVLVCLLLFLVLSSCSSPKKLSTAENSDIPTAELQNGLVLFDQHCATCHPGGRSGLGPAIINKPLPKFLMKFQIRQGIGVMPDFDEEILTDEQVDDIAEYLVYLRKQD